MYANGIAVFNPVTFRSLCSRPHYRSESEDWVGWRGVNDLQSQSNLFVIEVVAEVGDTFYEIMAAL